MDRTKICAGLIAGLLMAGLSLAGCSRPREVTVGSKNFTEQLLLGEMIAQQIERRLHASVRRKLDLGGTLLAHQALVKGEIDLYPEYTGTALTAVLKKSPASDPAAVLAMVREGYRQWNLAWLNPFGFDNTFAMVVRSQDARERQISTLSAAAADPRGYRLGAGYEFVQRPDGLAGLVKIYGLNFRGSVKTMDLGLLYKALEQNQVDMVAASATDGVLAALPVAVLQDDKHYFPPYEAAIVVREQTLREFNGLREALQELEGKLSNETMRKLNYEIDGKHRALSAVARDFLAAHP